jgi:hypothetical protein
MCQLLGGQNLPESKSSGFSHPKTGAIKQPFGKTPVLLIKGK